MERQSDEICDEFADITDSFGVATESDKKLDREWDVGNADDESKAEPQHDEICNEFSNADSFTLVTESDNKPDKDGVRKPEQIGDVIKNTDVLDVGSDDDRGKLNDAMGTGCE